MPRYILIESPDKKHPIPMSLKKAQELSLLYSTRAPSRVYVIAQVMEYRSDKIVTQA